ncbi:MAG: tautomerase [Betaproteobacteria bacterium]|jgi:phenylpyruvate tautomerase PptA (4-oxalocrotonate tautomerase family)|nr:tautomerase [Betaproteobacteria bacterium]NBP44988.1 tautomerase [Betaproteobacteria bacterium]
MPVVSITLLPGYSPQARERLVERTARSVRSVIAASNAGTTVFVNEAATYQRDGKRFTVGGAELPDASALVRQFLERMQVRDLEAAKGMLAAGFEMTFPGAAPMREFSQLLDWAKTRYSKIGKQYERFDECWGEDHTVVYCSGTLEGIWLDGSPFSGIRFIDRFEVAQGLIQRQDVWNDLAEVKALAKG